MGLSKFKCGFILCAHCLVKSTSVLLYIEPRYTHPRCVRTDCSRNKLSPHSSVIFRA